MKGRGGFGSGFRWSDSPGTIAILLAVVLCALLSAMLQGKLAVSLALWSDFSNPWAVVTYPFAQSLSSFGLALAVVELFWLYFVGKSVESELGTKKFLLFFAGLTIVAGLVIAIGLKLGLPIAVPIFGIGLPLAGLTVAWGTRHPNETVYLFGFLPVLGWIITWFTAGITLFGYAALYQAPQYGLLACVHLILAALYVRGQLPGAGYRNKRSDPINLKATERMSEEYYEDVRKREKDREERERLRRLFENSDIKDPD